MALNWVRSPMVAQRHRYHEQYNVGDKLTVVVILYTLKRYTKTEAKAHPEPEYLT